MIVFVDCGSHKGNILNRFKRNHPDCKEFYAFECNPFINNNYGENVKTIKSAVWIYDGFVSFYNNRNILDSESPSVFSDKTTGELDKTNPIEVPCIDFGNWLNNTFLGRNVYVHVKMNIEGAEYPVLENLIETGFLKIISELHIQWHYDKIPSIGINRHNILIEKMKLIKSLSINTGYGKI
jgi:FkbM family methyltransferase